MTLNMGDVEFIVDLSDEQVDKLQDGEPVILHDSAGRVVKINPRKP